MSSKLCLIRNNESVEEAVRKYLSNINYNKDKVVARHFAGERVKRVLRTGTDRTKHSLVWAHHYDYWGAKPTDSSLLTYAWTVDLTQESFKVIRTISAPTDFSLFFTCPEGAVLYDPSKLERKSECEYHFLTLPIEAMLGVFINPHTVAADNVLQEKLRFVKTYIKNLGVYARQLQRQKQISKNTMYINLGEIE